MPSNLKKLIHARIAKTGESYQTALRQVRSAAQKPTAIGGTAPVPEPTAVVFGGELLTAASRSPRHSAPLLHRWAVMSGERGAALREQIERAASRVPVELRPKVLGPLLAKSAPDDQVRAATGSLLLGKTLIDHGWSVEFEPQEAGGTPDFKVTKNGATFLVEVRRVAAPKMSPSDRDIARVRDALDGIKTRTPIGIRAVSIAGGASLKPFRAYMTQLLAGNPRRGQHSFQDGDVYIGFEVHKTFDEPMSAIVGWTYSPVYGGQHDEVKAHINEKLSKYKFPLIVALDFVDAVDPFRTVEEVLLGRETIQVQIDLTGGGQGGKLHAGRADDGILVHRGADGDRARARLQAVLAFGLLSRDDGAFEVGARMFGNPAAEVPLRLREFAPIPRLVVAEQTETERRLRYLDADDAAFDPETSGAWRHVP